MLFEINDFPLWRHFGTPFGPHGDLLAPSLEPYGALWGHLGTVLGSPGAILEPPGAIFGRFGVSLWPSWSLLLPSWDLLGHLEPTGSPYGCHFASFWVDFGSILGPFWIHFWHFKIMLHQPKLTDIIQNPRKLSIQNGNQNQFKSVKINPNQSKSIKTNQNQSHPEPRFLESNGGDHIVMVGSPIWL